MHKSNITLIRLPQGHLKPPNQRRGNEIQLSTGKFDAQAFSPTFAERHLELPPLVPGIAEPAIRVKGEGIWEDRFGGMSA